VLQAPIFDSLSFNPFTLLDNGLRQKAVSIGDDMALAPLHFLARAIAAHTPAFLRFDRLAVNHSGAG